MTRWLPRCHRKAKLNEQSPKSTGHKRKSYEVTPRPHGNRNCSDIDGEPIPKAEDP